MTSKRKSFAALFGMMIACQPIVTPARPTSVPPICRQDAITGSAPKIMAGIVPIWQSVFDRGRGVAITGPYGPPQGSLDPNLRAFLEGRRDFALLTREIAEADLAAFRAFHRGADPIVLPVAAGNWNRFGYVDAVVMIVHRSNPIRSLSLGQIDAIFSTSRWRGSAAVRSWGDLGLGGPWRVRTVTLAGGGGWANEESARALKIRRRVLSVGGQAGVWRAAPDSGGEADVVARVGRDPSAIGFTGMGHLSPEVRSVPIAGIALTRASAANGRYPLLRTVDLLTAPGPHGMIDPAIARFARYLVSRDGQAAVGTQGDFKPLPARTLRQIRERLGPETCRPGVLRHIGA